MQRHGWAVTLICGVTLAAAGGDPAAAAAPDDWRALQREIAAPYPGLEQRGLFTNYLDAAGIPWPVPNLGYALVQSGIANGRTAQIDSGVRTINAYLRRIKDGGVFDHFAVVSTYNLMRSMLPEHRSFSTHKSEWERWIHNQPLHWLPKTGHYANKYMVEVVAVLEARRSGLPVEPRAQRLAMRVLDQVTPEIAQATSTRVAGAPALVLSDPSNDALAYHALTLGFLARAVDLLGSAASPQSRDALQRIARASWALTAPDGDLAYIGRSQQQAWALTMTAYGSEVAAADADATWAPRFRAVADRALARLRAAHGVGPFGLWITPSRSESIGAGRHGVDTYAGTSGYSGLTLTALSWAIEHAAAHDRPTSGQLAGDSPGAWEFGSRRTRFRTVRTGTSWFAVKSSRSSGARDLRYDFGLVALKQATAAGAWVDVVRPRPHTTRGRNSAGPVLIERGGARAMPDGTTSSVSPAGVVTVNGGYRDARRHRVGSRETFRFAPVACGVRATFTRRTGGALEYSVFFRRRPRQTSEATLVGEPTAVTASPRPTVRLTGGYASATDGDLVRATLRFPPGHSPVRITICAA